MRRKALQGFANNLCQMFVGHQAYHDVQDILMPLAEGRQVALEINLLTGQCVAEGVVLSLHISQVTHDWLAEHLRRQRIPAVAIQAATLRVEYRAWQVKYYRSPKAWWDRLKEKWGRPVWYFLEAETEFLCRAAIQTSDYEYLSIDGKTGDGSPRQIGGYTVSSEINNGEEAEP